AVERSPLVPDAPKPHDTKPVAHADYTLTLSKIVETQHQIQVRHLDLENAMLLVAERLVQSAGAGGTAIGILDGTKLRYRAAFGSLTPAVGTEVPMDKALCVSCLKTGQVFRCSKVNLDFPVDTDECRRDIQSMIAVPVFC